MSNRVSQVAVEAIYTPIPDGVITQVAVEVVISKTRSSQSDLFGLPQPVPVATTYERRGSGMQGWPIGRTQKMMGWPDKYRGITRRLPNER